MIEKRFDYVMSVNDNARKKLETNKDFFDSGWKNAIGSIRSAKRSLVEAANALPKDTSIPFTVFYNISESLKKINDADHVSLKDKNSSFDINEIVQVYINKFLPIRIILRFDENGNIEGLCEDSFSMSWMKDRVQVYWSGKAYSILGEHQLDAVRDSAVNAKKFKAYAFDPMDSMCPVKLDLARWLNGVYSNNKYEARNSIFEKKIFEVDEEDGCLA